MEKFLNKKEKKLTAGFTRIVDFGEAAKPRAKGASSKFTTGFMLLEALVAISVITIAILSAMAVSEKAVQVSRRAFHSEQAVFLAEEGAEIVRILRDNDWANISSLTPGTAYFAVFSGGTWTLSPTPNSLGIFTRQVSVQDVERNAATGDIVASGTADSGSKLITVSVFWQEGGTTVNKTLQFYIFNIFS